MRRLAPLLVLLILSSNSPACFNHKLKPVFFIFFFQSVPEHYCWKRSCLLPSWGTGCVSQKRYVCFLACCRVLGRPWPKEKRCRALWISCCFFSGREFSYDRTRQTRRSYCIIFRKKIECWLLHSSKSPLDANSQNCPQQCVQNRGQDTEKHVISCQVWLVFINLL